jgi:hypothetical protein
MFEIGWSRLAPLTALAVAACTRVPAVVVQSELETPKAAPSVVVEAPSVPPTCIARTPPGAMLLIPDTAEWVVHVGPRALLRSPAYRLFAGQIEQSSEWTQMVDILRPCGVAVEHIDHLVVGFNAAEDFAAVLVAPGVARPEVSRCLIMQIQTAASEQAIAEVRPLPGDASVSIIEFTDGRAYLFGEDMLALSTSAWQDTIADLSSCRGAPAAYGPLATPLRGLDIEAPLWLVGGAPASTLAPVANTLGIDLTAVSSLSASVHLDEGATLRARVHMLDATSASATAQTLQSLMPLVGSALPPELAGVPSRVVLVSSDAEVRFDATLRPEELRFIASQSP